MAAADLKSSATLPDAESAAAERAWKMPSSCFCLVVLLRLAEVKLVRTIPLAWDDLFWAALLTDEKFTKLEREPQLIGVQH